MGVYLNSLTAYTLYKNETQKPYFVDKTLLLEELFPFVMEGNNYICITRPRRFGKTIMANMIASFFGKGRDSHDIFDRLSVAESEDYHKHLNQYNVIHISFHETPDNCQCYQQYIERIRRRLIKDLKRDYVQCDINEEDALWDILNDIYEFAGGERFLFVLDEWDYIFHQEFIEEKDKKAYLLFLGNLLKDKPYVSLAYMTGILPIAKYSSGSELNMFLEYTMVTEEKFCEYFGFTESEVDELYKKYLMQESAPNISREGLQYWYDGYYTRLGEQIYNPRSVTAALRNNNLGNYWTSSGPYDEIFYYVRKNVDAVKDELALMVSGAGIPVKISEYAATSMNLNTKEEIFSAMVVYGFLSYKNGSVFIPNRELMDKFADMVRKESSLGYVYRLAKVSERMLRATLVQDTETMQEILEFVHNTEIPILSYNHEIELTAVVNLVYLSARDFYRVEREDKAGIGYVDFIFYPEIDMDADCIILELKVDDTPKEAIRQIKSKKYEMRFKGKAGVQPRYSGRILAVGIAYDKKTKKHECMIEVLNEAS